MKRSAAAAALEGGAPAAAPKGARTHTINLLDFHTDLLRYILGFLQVWESLAARYSCRRLRGLIAAPNCRLGTWAFCASAMANNYLAQLKWARANDFHVRFIGLFATSAARADIIPTLEFAHNDGILSDDITVEFARQGFTEKLAWAGSKGYRSTREHVAAAAGSGQLEVLRWLHMQNIPFTDEASDSAARMGHLHVIKWMVRQRIRLSGNVRNLFVSIDHLEGFKWIQDMMSRQCIAGPLQKTLEYARLMGSTKIVDYIETGIG